MSPFALISLNPGLLLKISPKNEHCEVNSAHLTTESKDSFLESVKIAAMILVWQYGEKSRYESWKGLSWGMVFVAIQGALTVIGNATMCIPAYRIYKASQENSIDTSTSVSISILLLLSIFMIFKEFIEGDVSNGASLLAAIHIFTFKKAMSLYTTERARNEVITAEDGDAGLEDSRVEDSSGDVDAGVKDSGNISNGGSCLLVVKPKLIEFEWVISEVFKSLRCLAVP
ncbi:hypothetical protein L2E82_21517 [Cichorium intybus]|uniref:Uncharacterized protein n=1 Tax=Cichorium intybus TaxID=13427 RepID=A0ACB9DVQ3_CICIN|nr:hypothetical protein L2E82_21517 [Cichorium intybus]